MFFTGVNFHSKNRKKSETKPVVCSFPSVTVPLCFFEKHTCGKVSHLFETSENVERLRSDCRTLNTAHFFVSTLEGNGK
ncbi:hypothetical protein Ocin01_00581 [Orchesella cincta]|uniref:Uncharacterized protein n=1 Tax=Orchesella cincta TaxID=48709 RepID=A0A1D2NLT4_ORCCI|nr:hypothetical protein Ocin01_00581 [Orchesella cincta]